MKHSSALIAAVITTVGILACARASSAQGSILVTFDGPPSPPPPGTGYITRNYAEAGMWFTPSDPLDLNSYFGRSGGGIPFAPDNGTAYLQWGLRGFMMRTLSGSTFNLFSIDLAELSTGSAVPLTVRFVGYRHDGTVVTTDFVTDGIIDGTGPLADFQTFYFDSQFRDLDRVEIPTSGWSVDNLVVSVPEPSAVAVLAVGSLAVAAFRRRRQRWT